jgi:hypothetical protein
LQKNEKKKPELKLKFDFGFELELGFHNPNQATFNAQSTLAMSAKQTRKKENSSSSFGFKTPT